MYFSSRDIIRSFPELSGLSDEECERLKHYLNKNERRLELIPAVVGFVLLCGWMVVFGKGTDFLERHSNWDLLGYLDRLGWIGLLIGLALWLGTATCLSLGVGFSLWVRLVRGAIETHLKNRLCLWCAYCLTGLEATEGRVRCPECGQPSPVRSNTE